MPAGRASSAGFSIGRRHRPSKKLSAVPAVASASLIEAPLLWVGRLCVFYVLPKAGLAGSDDYPLVSVLFQIWEAMGSVLNLVIWASPNGLGACTRNQGGIGTDKRAADRRKLVSKWNPTTKRTVRRNYRVPNKCEGRRLLKAIASSLS